MRVVYLMGTGRSGSTVLQLLLASAPGAFAAGELTWLHRDGTVRDVTCTCGEPASRCPVWGEVLRRVATVDHSRSEWHTGVPRMLAGLLPRGYAVSQRALFAAIRDVTGAETVIDSSKFVARGLGLTRALPGEVKTLMLTRSPEGLLHSFARQNPGEQPPKSPAAVERYHASILGSMAAARSRVDGLHLTYEQLVARPADTLRRVGLHTGLDLSEAVRRVDAAEPFAVGHLLTGNRLRASGEVVFAPDLPDAAGLGADARVRRMRKVEAALGFKEASWNSDFAPFRIK